MVSEHASPFASLGGVDAGGQNVHVAALASALGRAGHEVVVHTRRDDPTLPEFVDFARGVRVHHVDAGPATELSKDALFPYMPEFAERLATVWSKDVPAVVHSHFWMSGWAALQATRRSGIPVVHTYHALGITKRRHQRGKDTSPAERLRVEREIARDADHIVATSSEEVFELVRMGADARRVSLVPCGVDLEHFVPGRARSGVGHDILVVGRLVERKGIGNVVAALAKLPDARLAVAGGSTREELDRYPEAQRLRRLAAAAGVADRVELLGRVEHSELPALYHSADVVACVPWYEPFGLVALEAMACRRPVVAAAVGGLVDTVIDGVTGIHVAPRDVGDLAAALRRVLHDGALRTSLGRAAAERARKRYGWSTIAHDTVQAYAVARATATRPWIRVG
jgi:glycosyltransferase involved in cell wall biosynthesis